MLVKDRINFQFYNSFKFEFPLPHSKPENTMQLNGSLFILSYKQEFDTYINHMYTCFKEKIR